MRAGVASLTAQIVSFSRGLATVAPRTREPLSDHVAPSLLPAPFAATLRACAASPRVARLTSGAVSLVSLGLVDHLALRTLAIDDAIRDAVRPRGRDGSRAGAGPVSPGATQLVILGAGLDARAWRLPELAGLSAYEVDHPDTQRHKRERLGALVPAAREVRFVSVDFARDDLGERLGASGHDPKARTVWVWEGVTMYLPREATRATLDVVAARSARGSVLAVTYTTPETMHGWLRPATRVVFGVLGEPIVGAITPRELRDELRVRDFDVLHDDDDETFRARYGGRKPRVAPFAPERLCVARRL